MQAEAKLRQALEKPSFGEMLRYFRGRTIDKRSGKSLSQGRLGDKLFEHVGLSISRNTVNNWENGKSYLNPHLDRPLLTAIVAVLYNCRGIETLAEANQLLTAGGFRDLDSAEAVSIDPKWVESVDRVEAGPEQRSPGVLNMDQSLGGLAPVTVNIAARGPIPVVLQPSLSDHHAESDRAVQPENRLVNILVQALFAVLEKIPDWLLDRTRARGIQAVKKDITLIDPDCGNQAIDLKQQRLKISAAFGSYFTVLLEKEHSYFPIRGQVDLSRSSTPPELESFQQIYWSMLYPRGPEVVMIAAEGGMGKSTLAAKIIRCLYSDNAVDLLLGDSAKSQVVDPLTGEVIEQRAEFSDIDSFLHKVSSQLGLEYSLGESDQQGAVRKIKDRLEGRRAILVMDNLETVRAGADLLNMFRLLAGRDTRILVTTRRILGITHQTPGIFLIRLNPIKDLETARDFLRWHINTNTQLHQGLNKLLPDLEDRENVRHLIDKTGGIPLLMQLVLSDIARTTWSRLEKLPTLFGKELLGFLYRERWTELGEMGRSGQEARQLLFHIRKQSHHGQINYENLLQWGKTARGLASVDEPLKILQERFLIVNSDLKQGNFSIFPSLADFLETQQASNPL